MICPLTLEDYPYTVSVMNKYSVICYNQFDKILWDHGIEYIIDVSRRNYCFKTEKDKLVATLLI